MLSYNLLSLLLFLALLSVIALIVVIQVLWHRIDELEAREIDLEGENENLCYTLNKERFLNQ
jgi:hypothetical protein